MMEHILISGANRGIGLELTRQLLASGERVFAGCRRPQEAKALHALKMDYERQLFIVQLDVTADQSLSAAKKAVLQETDRLDWLINNAAILYEEESLHDFDAQLMAHTLDVNVSGVMRLTSRFVDLLRRSEHGKLINISSNAGSLRKAPSDERYSYNASKAALNMLTRLLARRLKREGIVVVSLHPGWVHTEMGGEDAPISPEESAEKMIRLIAGLNMADTDKFFTFRGKEFPW